MNPIELLNDEICQQGLWEKELTLDRNEYLTVTGKIDMNLYWVIEGALRIFVVDEFEENTIRFGYKDNLIAALDSFITETPTELYIQALKKSRVKVIKKSSFMSMINSSERCTKIWIELLHSFVKQQMEREQDILTSSPLRRYRRVFERSPELFQEIPHKYIASYLRMTPETLSRIKKS